MSINYFRYPGVLFFFQARASPVESPIGAQPIGRHPTLHASTRSIIEPVNSCRARLCRGPAGPPSNLRQLLPRRSPSARRPAPPPIRTPAPPLIRIPPRPARDSRSACREVRRALVDAAGLGACRRAYAAVMTRSEIYHNSSKRRSDKSRNVS